MTKRLRHSQHDSLSYLQLAECSTTNRRFPYCRLQLYQCCSNLQCSNVFSLAARAGGHPAAAGASTATMWPAPLDTALLGCSEADPLLWAPLLLPKAGPLPQQHHQQHYHLHHAHTGHQPVDNGLPSGPEQDALQHPFRQRQLAVSSGAQPVPPGGHLVALQGAQPGSGLQISAHRPAAASAPITIGGRRHDWWTLQLQEQRTGFVQQVGSV